MYHGEVSEFNRGLVVSQPWVASFCKTVLFVRCFGCVARGKEHHCSNQGAVSTALVGAAGRGQGVLQPCVAFILRNLHAIHAMCELRKASVYSFRAPVIFVTAVQLCCCVAVAL